MTTDTPNWRQFAREVCWSPTISNALRLLALAAPQEGRPTRFRCEGIAVDRLPSGEFTCWRGSAGAGISRIAGNGDQVLEALKPIPAHGGSGAALREWLAMWGWVPPPKRQASQPPPMII
jgi:hypothetical protein